MGGKQVIFLPNQLVIEETGDNMAVSLPNQLAGEEADEMGDNPAECLPNQLVGEEVGDKQVAFLLKCPESRGRVEKVKNPGANQASFPRGVEWWRNWRVFGQFSPKDSKSRGMRQKRQLNGCESVRISPKTPERWRNGR